MAIQAKTPATKPSATDAEARMADEWSRRALSEVETQKGGASLKCCVKDVLGQGRGGGIEGTGYSSGMAQVGSGGRPGDEGRKNNAILAHTERSGRQALRVPDLNNRSEEEFVGAKRIREAWHRVASRLLYLSHGN